MEDQFKIYVLRLKDGREEKIQESLSPEFLGVDENDLKFQAPIEIKGEAALLDGTLVLKLSIHTEATMPCAICNDNISVEMNIPDFCYDIQAAKVKSGIFNFKEVLREAILLEVPFTTECNRGKCPERAALAKYFKQEDHHGGTTSENE